MEDHRPVPGVAGLHVVGGLLLPRPEEQVFAAMLEGWGSQQLARNLAPGTVEGRQRAVRRLRRSTLGSYQVAVRLFCAS